MKNYMTFKNRDGSLHTCYRSPLHGDYSLCGDAFDSTLEFEDVELIGLQEKGRVTCKDCKKIINHIRKAKL